MRGNNMYEACLTIRRVLSALNSWAISSGLIPAHKFRKCRAQCPACMVSLQRIQLSEYQIYSTMVHDIGKSDEEGRSNVHQ